LPPDGLGLTFGIVPASSHPSVLGNMWGTLSVQKGFKQLPPESRPKILTAYYHADGKSVYTDFLGFFCGGEMNSSRCWI
jgi:hypothetical protein